MSPAPQTSYAENIKPGVEGMIATEWGGNVDRETRICETAAGIGFGRAVSQGSGERGAVLGGAIADFLGITIRDVTLIVQPGQTADLYQRYQNMGVMNAGDMWVIAVNGCTVGDQAQFDGTTGQFNPAAAGITIPNSRWLTTAAAGALAKLRLTAPNTGAPLA